MKVWKMILSLIGVTIVGGIVWTAKKTVEKSGKLEARYKNYYDVTNQWLRHKNEKKSIREYFINNNYDTIAIYGMGELGNRLYEELKSTDIKVAYFIDKNAEEIYYGLDDIPVVGLEEIERQDKVDVIIVTPIYDFDSIEESLSEYNIDADIVSLEEVIYEM